MKNKGFHDGDWGTVEREIFEAQIRREGGESTERTEPDVSAGADARRAKAAGLTVRMLTAGETRGYFDVKLTGEQLASVEEHARHHGLDSEEAFTSILRRGLSLSNALVAADHESDDAPLPMVDLRGLPAADRPDVALCAAGAVEPVTPPPPPPGPARDEEPDFTLPGDPQDGKEGK